MYTRNTNQLKAASLTASVRGAEATQGSVPYGPEYALSNDEAALALLSIISCARVMTTTSTELLKAPVHITSIPVDSTMSVREQQAAYDRVFTLRARLSALTLGTPTHQEVSVADADEAAPAQFTAIHEFGEHTLVERTSQGRRADDQEEFTYLIYPRS